MSRHTDLKGQEPLTDKEAARIGVDARTYQPIHPLKEQIAKLNRAWNDEGINPEYHRAMKLKLAQEWPTLYEAIIFVITSTTSETNSG